LSVTGNITITGGSGIANFTDAGALATKSLVCTSDLKYVSAGSSINNDPNFTDAGAWMSRGAGAYVLTTVTDGKVGNNVLRSATNSASYPFTKQFFPVDANKTYRIRAWIRKSDTSNGCFYMSWQTYNSAGTKIPANEGYYVCVAIIPPTTWTEYVAYVGAGTSWPATSDARTMKIGFLLNYGATAGYMEVQDFRIEEVLPGTLIKGMDANSNLLTSVIPATAVTPSAAGLYLGSNNMGYHNGTVWKTYMDNTGNFYLGGSAAGCGLAWNAATNCLTVCGCITSCAGTIGGWNLASTYMCATSCVGGAISFCSGASDTSIQLYRCNGTSCYGTISLGNVLRLSGGWSSNVYHGISIIGNGSCQMFYAMTRLSDNAFLGQIAGWDFNAACLYKGNLILNSSGAISGCYSGDATGWCIDAAGNAKFNNATVKGTVCASAGCIGCFSLASGLLNATMTAQTQSAITQSYASGIYNYCSRISSSNLCFDDKWTGYTCCRYAIISAFALTTSNCTAVNCEFVGSYGSDGLAIFSASPATNSYTTIYGFRCGTTASDAPIQVCTYGGNQCFAICTYGRISVNNVVCSSDVNLKTDIQHINVLHYLRSLPITKWRFKDGENYHVGPMAQDFQRVFNFSKEDKTVYGLDGIALKGVQELDECVTTLKNDNDAIRAKLQKLECEMAAIREMIN
jgi:hypothetical protein